jgi:monofunctional biosynthetic peptidoglycan transglycosylase
MRLFPRHAAIYSLVRHNPVDTAYMRAESQTLQTRDWIPLDSVSNALQWAILYGEDRHFLKHRGITLAGVGRSWKQLTDQTHIWPGGSSISMQLSRNLFLSQEKSISRKVREAYLACVMEIILTKARIFELYLNVLELGAGIWGVNEGCRHYCGKQPSQINLVEAIFLSAILGAPSRPIKGGNLARVHAKFAQIAVALWRNRLVTSDQFVELNQTGSVVLRHLGRRGRLTEAMGFCKDSSSLIMNSGPFDTTGGRSE